MSDTFDHEGDAWNDFYSREDGGASCSHTARAAPTCTRCGKTGLNWQHDGDSWVLHEGKFKVHRCPVATSLDDFEDLT